jgi:hypothetical protein
MIPIDTNVIMYAAGAGHPHKGPSVALLERVSNGELEATADAAVLHEILHRYRAIGRWEEGRQVYDLTRRLFPNVAPVTADVVCWTREARTGRGNETRALIPAGDADDAGRHAAEDPAADVDASRHPIPSVKCRLEPPYRYNARVRVGPPEERKPSPRRRKTCTHAGAKSASGRIAWARALQHAHVRRPACASGHVCRRWPCQCAHSSPRGV